MSEHHTFFGKIVGPVWDALKKVFHDAYENADHVLLSAAVTITNMVKDALNSGVVKFIVDATPTNLDNKLLDVVNANLPKIIAAELLLQSISKDSTATDIQTVEKNILVSFGGLSDGDKEEFYTGVTANTIKLLYDAKHGQKITFATAVEFGEKEYQAYLKLKEAEVA